MPALPISTPAGSWSFIVMADTQTSACLYPDNMTDVSDWIAANYDSEDIKLVLHVGDIVDTEASTDEWDVMDGFYDALDAINMPYLCATGEHDVTTPYSARLMPRYDTYFPTTRFTGQSWWYGGFMGSKRKYRVFTDDD